MQCYIKDHCCLCVCFQVAGVCGVSGHSAAVSAEAGFKPGLGPVGHLRRSRTCVRVWWRRAGLVTHRPAPVSSPLSVCACIRVSKHPCLSVSDLLCFVVKYEQQVCANVCFKTTFYILFSIYLFYLVHSLAYPSSISQCFDLRSACWKGDFDRWEKIMTWSTVFQDHACTVCQNHYTHKWIKGHRKSTSERYYVEMLLLSCSPA